jgi:hypothetical protein
VSTLAAGAALGRLWWDRVRAEVARRAAAVESWPVPAVLAGLVVVEWAAVFALARSVRHNGWIYYQGGDQLWLHTLGWLLGHGELAQTQVGYGWPAVLAPIARIAGPNLVSSLPAIVLLNVVVLLPAAMLAVYGIAARIGGRLFGYWTVLVWIAVPFIGIRYTNPGYHQKYTELLLPQAFGLTAMADFPAMVAATVSIYFCVKLLFERSPRTWDAAAAGVAAGAAIAVKPSAAIFLAGPALALAGTRRPRLLASFAAGLAPALVTLTVWKERGLGQIPIIGSASAEASSHSFAPPFAAGLSKYTDQLDWGRFTQNLDLIREHFWSVRIIEWLVIAGLVGLGRRSPKGLLLVGGSFAAVIVVKGSYTSASVEDGSVFRIMMPAFPMFVLLLAAVPLLLPHAPDRLSQWREAFPERSPRLRRWLVLAAVSLTAVAPLAAVATARTHGGAADAASLTVGTMPVPANIDLGVTATVSGRRVVLHWRDGVPAGGSVFYRIWRGPLSGGDGFVCDPSPGARSCRVGLPEVGVASAGTFIDRPPRGTWIYRVAVAANWLNDPGYGDVYLVGKPIRVRVG